MPGKDAVQPVGELVIPQKAFIYFQIQINLIPYLYMHVCMHVILNKMLTNKCVLH